MQRKKKKFQPSLELLDKKIISKYVNLKYHHHLENMVIFDELPSTNNYLTELAKNEIYETCGGEKINICLAERQTAGKGRLGRSWISPYAKNIYLSMLCKFIGDEAKVVGAIGLSGLSLAIAVAISESLKIYGVKEQICLKWPNDIIWQNRKLAGILIEIFEEVQKTQQVYDIYNKTYNVVIGVGVNVNMSLHEGKNITQPWCDIATVTNSIPKRNKLVGILLEQILAAIDLYKSKGLQAFIEPWMKLDVCYGKPVAIITPKKTIFGIGQGIDAKGHFMLHGDDGKMHSFAFGEVSLRF